jgi:hypothetical protein
MTKRTSVIAALLICLPVCLHAASAEEVSELKIGEEVRLTKTQISSTPVACFGGGVYLVVWQEGFSGKGAGSDIMGLRLKPGSLQALDEKPLEIASAKGNQDTPAISFGGGNFLVAWSDMRSGRVYDVYAARVSPEGKVLDPNGIPVASGPHTQAVPAVASHGKNFLVAWMEYVPDPNRKYFGFYHVRGARLSADGKVLDTAPIQFASDAGDPSIAYNGTHYLVAWGGVKTVSGVRVDPATGKAVGSPAKLSKKAPDLPRVVSNGKDFLYTASARPGPNYWGWGGPGFIVAERVTADGATPDIKADVGYYMGNAAAGNVPNYIDCAGWRRGEGKCAKNWPAGEPNGFKGTPYHTWPYRFSSPAPTGDGYVVAWVRMHIRQQIFLYDPDVIVTYVEPEKNWRRVGEEPPPEGANARKYGLPAAATPERGEGMPWLAAGPGREILLVYEAETPGEHIRISARKITLK